MLLYRPAMYALLFMVAIFHVQGDVLLQEDSMMTQDFQAAITADAEKNDGTCATNLVQHAAMQKARDFGPPQSSATNLVQHDAMQKVNDFRPQLSTPCAASTGSVPLLLLSGGCTQTAAGFLCGAIPMLLLGAMFFVGGWLAFEIFVRYKAAPEAPMEAAAGGHTMTEIVRTRLGVQVIHVLLVMLGVSHVSVIIPQAYAVALELGQGGIYSGLIISSYCFLPLVGIIFMRTVLTPWNQVRNRWVAIISLLLVAALDLLCGVVVSPPPESLAWLFTLRTRSILLLVARALSGLFMMFPTLLCRLMAVNVTSGEDMVTLSLFRTSAQVLGTAVGPIVPWAVHAICPSLSDVALVNRALLMFSSFTFMIGVACYCLLPESLELLMPEGGKGKGKAKGKGKSEGVEVLVEPEELDLRLGVVRLTVYNCFMRTFMTASVKSATSMVLELEFLIPTPDIGLYVGVSFLTVVPLFFFLTGIRKSSMLSDTTLFIVLAVISLIAAMFIMKSLSDGIFGPDKAWIVLLAVDAVIFVCAMMAGGIADGYAMQYVVPGTFWDQENYAVWDRIICNFAQVPGPPLARWIFLAYGRSAYAGIQGGLGALFLVTSFCITWRINKLLANKEKRDKEACGKQACAALPESKLPESKLPESKLPESKPAN